MTDWHSVQKRLDPFVYNATDRKDYREQGEGVAEVHLTLVGICSRDLEHV